MGAVNRAIVGFRLAIVTVSDGGVWGGMHVRTLARNLP